MTPSIAPNGHWGPRSLATADPLIVRISEQVENGGDVELQFRSAIDHEIVGHDLKTGHHDGIAEDVSRQGRRLGRRRRIARDRAKIGSHACRASNSAARGSMIDVNDRLPRDLS